MRDSVVFYRSFAEAIADLEERDQLAAFWNIVHYGLDGTEPTERGAATAVYRMARPQIDANNKRYQNGRKGGKGRTGEEPKGNQDEGEAEPRDNQDGTKAEPKGNQKEGKAKPKEKEKEKENGKENSLSGVKEKRFAPPTLENVSGYCREMGYSIDAQRFIDFYSSKGWMIGKNRMKDWKAAVRNWARQDKQEAGRRPPIAKPNSFHNFTQRDTDYDALVEELTFGFLEK